MMPSWIKKLLHEVCMSFVELFVDLLLDDDSITAHVYDTVLP